jgi:hypothetical protein
LFSALGYGTIPLISSAAKGAIVIHRRVLIPVLAAGFLVLPAAPASGASCVGQFASTVARQDGAAFGADISSSAQFASQPNFGAGVVAPFAHEPRDACFE